MNAITALASASPSPITGSGIGFVVDAANSPILDWAYNWTALKMDDTRGECAKPNSASAIASENGGTVELYLRTNPACMLAFFHGQDVVERAGTLVHETRHIDGPAHSLPNGRDVAFGAGGAWDYEATWLAQYGTSSVNSTRALRCSAIDSAKTIMALAYVVAGPIVETPVECM